MISAALRIAAALLALARIYRERGRAAYALLRGRGHVMQVTVGEQTREFLAVERKQ